jgi:5-methylcytosine-specific restriction endonuclease McrA
LCYALSQKFSLVQEIGIVKSNCDFCGKEFEHAYRKCRFCSDECRNGSKRKEPVDACVHCGNPIEGKRSNNQFCSQKCRLANWRKNNQGYDRAYAEKNPVKAAIWAETRLKNLRERLKDSAYKAQHDEKKSVRKHIRKHRMNNLPRTLTAADWRAALEYFDHKCAYCRTPLTKAHKEHFVPLSKGGGFTKDNIIPACSKCNNNKKSKNPIDWLASQIWGLIAYARVITYLESQKERLPQ